MDPQFSGLFICRVKVHVITMIEAAPVINFRLLQTLCFANDLPFSTIVTCQRFNYVDIFLKALIWLDSGKLLFKFSASKQRKFASKFYTVPESFWCSCL